MSITSAIHSYQTFNLLTFLHIETLRTFPFKITNGFLKFIETGKLYFKWEKYWEPGNHITEFLLWHNAKSNIFKQDAIEISNKSMNYSELLNDKIPYLESLVWFFISVWISKLKELKLLWGLVKAIGVNNVEGFQWKRCIFAFGMKNLRSVKGGLYGLQMCKDKQS